MLDVAGRHHPSPLLVAMNVVQYQRGIYKLQTGFLNIEPVSKHVSPQFMRYATLCRANRWGHGRTWQIWGQGTIGVMCDSKSHCLAQLIWLYAYSTLS